MSRRFLLIPLPLALFLIVIGDVFHLQSQQYYGNSVRQHEQALRQAFQQQRRNHNQSSSSSTKKKSKPKGIRKRSDEHHDKSIADDDSKSHASIAVHHNNSGTSHSDGRPPLGKLIHTNHSIIGDVRFLLDFAIVGFPKCGSTSLMNWLHQHDQIQCLQSEQWSLIWGKPHLLVKRLYLGLPPGAQYVRGYKCPADITGGHVMDYYRTYWPNTKLIVSIRHPVRWFESLYNYRIQNSQKQFALENHSTAESTTILPHPNRLVGVCRRGRHNTCTEKGNFALDLLRMGKTNLLHGDMPIISTNQNGSSTTMSALHDEIVGHYPRMWFNVSAVQPIPNPVFLMDISQLEGDQRRVQEFQQDLQHFLGLSSPLPNQVPHSSPGKEWNPETQRLKEQLKIDICQGEYIPVRQELMRIARLNSQWIRTVFLNLPGVHCSRTQLEEFLQTWMVDPCESQAATMHFSTDAISYDKVTPSTEESNLEAHDPSEADSAADSVLHPIARSIPIHTNKKEAWPPLDHYVDRFGNITGDVRHLLDFAVIGFGKCGTTAMLDWLKSHPQTQCIDAEVWDMVLGHPEALVKKLYDLPSGSWYKRGYKSPREIVDSRVLRYHRTYFPSTKLFVGIRHPVLWFESLYNFRVQNLKVKESDRMPQPNNLIGRCTKGMLNTCTEKGNFALNLLRLGKQNINGPQQSSTRAEHVLSLYKRKWFNATEVPAMSNDVFLFDVAQLGDTNESRSLQFRRDVQTFLGLEQELPPMPRSKPGKVWGPVVQAKKDKYRINICDDEFHPLRTNLMTIARLNAEWIRHEFLHYPGVHCSSRDYLENILQGWMHDPCDRIRNVKSKVATTS